MSSKIYKIIEEMSTTMNEIITILNDNSFMLEKIEFLIIKLIEYIKEYIQEYGGEILYKSDTDTIFDKLEFFLESYFNKLFQKNIPDLDFVSNYKQILNNEINKYKQKIDDDKKILFEVYQHYQKLEVKNIFKKFILNDETKKFFDPERRVATYNEYINNLTSVFIDKTKSFITNVVINTANKKRLAILKIIEQSLQAGEVLTKDLLQQKMKDLQIIKISEDIDDTIQLIMHSVKVYYQRMIYLKKKHDILKETIPQMMSEKTDLEKKIELILAKIDSNILKKQTEYNIAQQQKYDADEQYKHVKAVLEQKKEEQETAIESQNTAIKNQQQLHTASSSANIIKKDKLRIAKDNAIINTHPNKHTLIDKITSVVTASDLHNIKDWSVYPIVKSSIDEAVYAENNAQIAQNALNAANNALSNANIAVLVAKSAVSTAQISVNVSKDRIEELRLKILSIETAITDLLSRKDKDIESLNKNIETIDKNIEANNNLQHAITGTIVIPKSATLDASTTDEIDIFRNFGIFPLPSVVEYSIIQYLMSQNAVIKLFLFCELGGINQIEFIEEFFKLHNCKFSKENIMLINEKIKNLSVHYTEIKKKVKNATEAMRAKRIEVMIAANAEVAAKIELSTKVDLAAKVADDTVKAVIAAKQIAYDTQEAVKIVEIETLVKLKAKEMLFKARNKKMVIVNDEKIVVKRDEAIRNLGEIIIYLESKKTSEKGKIKELKTCSDNMNSAVTTLVEKYNESVNNTYNANKAFNDLYESAGSTADAINDKVVYLVDIDAESAASTIENVAKSIKNIAEAVSSVESIFTIKDTIEVINASKTIAEIVTNVKQVEEEAVKAAINAAEIVEKAIEVANIAEDANKAEEEGKKTKVEVDKANEIVQQLTDNNEKSNSIVTQIIIDLSILKSLEYDPQKKKKLQMIYRTAEVLKKYITEVNSAATIVLKGSQAAEAVALGVIKATKAAKKALVLEATTVEIAEEAIQNAEKVVAQAVVDAANAKLKAKEAAKKAAAAKEAAKKAAAEAAKKAAKPKSKSKSSPKPAAGSATVNSPGSASSSGYVEPELDADPGPQNEATIDEAIELAISVNINVATIVEDAIATYIVPSDGSSAGPSVAPKTKAKAKATPTILTFTDSFSEKATTAEEAVVAFSVKAKETVEAVEIAAIKADEAVKATEELNRTIEELNKAKEELNKVTELETEVKNKLFIAMLIKVCVSGNVKFYGLDESLDKIELQLFNFQKELYNVTTKYLEYKRKLITP